MDYIPIYRPSLSGNEKKYVDECIDTSWISSKGKYNSLFEDMFSHYNDVKYATTVTNGTLAVHLALLALGIGVGDEVIVPTLTYIASANAVKYTGADVVFADSDMNTWQIDVNDVERKITKKTKAILVVHLYGHPCDMDSIKTIAKKYNLFVIEDCAEAIGSEYKGRKVGTFGDVAAFSFFGNKTITCGEGGMVVTNNRSIFEKSVHIKGQGLAKDREYWHDIIGYNYRMTNIAAAIGVAQLEQIERFIERKIYISEKYKKNLQGIDLQIHQSNESIKHTYWMVSARCDSELTRDKLRVFLRNNNIETRPTFYPIHMMPMYYKKGETHPVAEKIGLTGLNLPSFPSLKDEEIDYICETIIDYYNGENKKNG